MSRFLTGFIPLLLVWAFVGWSYYVYAIVYLLPMVLKVDLISIVWFSIYHLFLTLFTICYLRVTFGNPGSLPENLKIIEREGEFYIDESTSRTVQRKAKNTKREDGAQKRICLKCRFQKPDRAHHCRICNRCSLRMDHHCPWVANCVGIRTHKFFLLWMFYIIMLCLTGFTSLFPFMLDNVFAGHSIMSNIQLLLIWVSCIGFGLGLIWFLSLHLKYVLQNVTTIETLERGIVLEVPTYHQNISTSQQPPPTSLTQTSLRDLTSLDEQETEPKTKYHQYLNNDNSFETTPSTTTITTPLPPSSQNQSGSMIYRNVERPYDVGAFENWKQIFGSNFLLWLLPIETDFQGIEFPLRKDLEDLEHEQEEGEETTITLEPSPPTSPSHKEKLLNKQQRNNNDLAL